MLFEFASSSKFQIYFSPQFVFLNMHNGSCNAPTDATVAQLKRLKENLQLSLMRADATAKISGAAGQRYSCGCDRADSGIFPKCRPSKVNRQNCHQRKSVSNCACEWCDIGSCIGEQKAVDSANYQQSFNFHPQPMYQPNIRMSEVKSPQENALDSYWDCDRFDPQAIVEKFVNSKLNTDLPCMASEVTKSKQRDCQDVVIELLNEKLQTSLKTVGDLTQTLNKSVVLYEHCKSELDRMKQERQNVMRRPVHERGGYKFLETVPEKSQVLQRHVQYERDLNECTRPLKMSEVDTMSLELEVQRRKAYRKRRSKPKVRVNRTTNQIPRCVKEPLYVHSKKQFVDKSRSLYIEKHPQRQICHEIKEDCASAHCANQYSFMLSDSGCQNVLTNCKC